MRATMSLRDRPLRHPLSSISLCAALALAGTGCEALQQAADALEQQQENQVDQAEQQRLGAMQEEERIAEKLSLHAKCINMAGKQINNSFGYYASRMNEDGTPANENWGGSIHEVNDSALTPCETADVESPKIPPSIPELETAQVEYTKAAKAYQAIAKDLKTYYKDKGYEKDDWKKGKDLAPKIEAAIKAFDEAANALHAEFDKQEDIIDEKMLAIIQQKEGHGAHWHNQHYLMKSRKFLACLDHPELTAKPCEDPFKQLSDAMTAFKKYYDGNKVEADAAASGFSGWVGDAEKFQAAADAMMGGLRDQDFTEDQINAVYDTYNTMINSSNFLMFMVPAN